MVQKLVPATALISDSGIRPDHRKMHGSKKTLRGAQSHLTPILPRNQSRFIVISVKSTLRNDPLPRPTGRNAAESSSRAILTCETGTWNKNQDISYKGTLKRALGRDANRKSSVFTINPVDHLKCRAVVLGGNVRVWVWPLLGNKITVIEVWPRLWRAYFSLV